MPSTVKYYDINDNEAFLEYSLLAASAKRSETGYIGAFVDDKFLLVEFTEYNFSNSTYRIDGERTSSWRDPEDGWVSNISHVDMDQKIYDKASKIMLEYDLNPFKTRMFCIPKVYHDSVKIGAIQTPKGKDAFLAPTSEQMKKIARCMDKCDYVQKNILDKIPVIKSLETCDENALAPYFEKCIEADCFSNKEWVDSFTESCQILKHTASHPRHDVILQMVQQAKLYCNRENVIAENKLKAAAVAELNKLKASKLPGAAKYCPPLNFVRQYTFSNFLQENKQKQSIVQEEKQVQPVQVAPSAPELPAINPDFAPPPYEPNDASNHLAALEVKEAPEVLEINSIRDAIKDKVGLRSDDGKTIYIDTGKSIDAIKVPTCIYKMFKEIKLKPYDKKPELAKEVLENIQKRAAIRSEDCRTLEQIEFCNEHSGIVLCPEAQTLMDFKRRIEDVQEFKIFKNNPNAKMDTVPAGLIRLREIIIKNFSKFSEVTEVIPVLGEMKKVVREILLDDDYTVTNEEMAIYLNIKRVQIKEPANNAPENAVGPAENSALSIHV